VALALTGCTKEVGPKEFVARVDDAFLTYEELAAARDSSINIEQQDREYINNWITTELLYQEAVRRGVHETAEFRRQLNLARRSLTVNAFLDKELYSDDTTRVSEDAVVALYNSGGGAFRLREDIANLSFALFADRDAANAFRSAILQGTSWENALMQIQGDSALAPQLQQIAYRQYFSQRILYPEELWKLTRTLSLDQPSFVVKTDAGYYVMMVHGITKRGEMPDLAYVRNEIRDRILIEERRMQYERLLANLRARRTVEVRITMTDTTAPAQD